MPLLLYTATFFFVDCLRGARACKLRMTMCAMTLSMFPKGCWRGDQGLYDHMSYGLSAAQYKPLSLTGSLFRGELLMDHWTVEVWRYRPWCHWSHESECLGSMAGPTKSLLASWSPSPSWLGKEAKEVGGRLLCSFGFPEYIPIVPHVLLHLLPPLQMGIPVCWGSVLSPTGNLYKVMSLVTDRNTGR